MLKACLRVNGTRLVALLSFCKTGVVKKIEGGNFGNASQVVDAWAQSLIASALFYLVRAVPRTVHPWSCSLPSLGGIVHLVVQYLAFILPIRTCMESIVYSSLTK